MVTNEPQGTSTIPTVDELAQELLMIQQSGPRKVAIIGTRNLPLTHQQLVEMLSYALVLSGNQIFTSGGANGTNMAVIRGAQRANPDRLSIILPQTIGQQPGEVRRAARARGSSRRAARGLDRTFGTSARTIDDSTCSVAAGGKAQGQTA